MSANFHTVSLSFIEASGRVGQTEVSSGEHFLPVRQFLAREDARGEPAAVLLEFIVRRYDGQGNTPMIRRGKFRVMLNRLGRSSETLQALVDRTKRNIVAVMGYVPNAGSASARRKSAMFARLDRAIDDVQTRDDVARVRAWLLSSRRAGLISERELVELRGALEDVASELSSPSSRPSPSSDRPRSKKPSR